MSYNNIAKILTYTGALPFLVFATLVYFDKLDISIYYFFAAVILSFLGGINWGLSLKGENKLVLLWSILPAVFAWAFLALHQQGLSQDIVLFMFLLLYVQQFLFDANLYKAKIIDKNFYSLRKYATILVGISLSILIYNQL